MGVSRRSAIRLSGVALCSGLAGCSSFNVLRSESSQVDILEITIANRDIEPHLIDVMVRDAEADAVVFWERYEADAAPATEEDLDFTTDPIKHWERPVPEPGAYVLYADAEREVDEDDSEWATAALADGGDCVEVVVGVERTGELFVDTTYPESCS